MRGGAQILKNPFEKKLEGPDVWGTSPRGGDSPLSPPSRENPGKGTLAKISESFLGRFDCTTVICMMN